MLKLILSKFGWLPASWRGAFWITLFFVMLASLLFWLDFFRGSVAEVKILVLTKSETIKTEQVVETLSDLAQNLSFYNRVVEGSDLTDEFAGTPPDKRKALWNEKFSITHSTESGVMVLSVQDASAEAAKQWAEQSTRTLLAVVATYYNIQTDIDLRIVEGPIVKTVLRMPFLYVVTSLISGLVVTSIFFWLLSMVPHFFARQKKEVLVKPASAFIQGESVPFIDPRKFIPSKPTNLSYERKSTENMPATPTHTAAPLDTLALPVAEEALPFEFESENLQQDAKIEGAPLPEMTVPQTQEPTTEEYKRRLNALLRGEK